MDTQGYSLGTQESPGLRLQGPPPSSVPLGNHPSAEGSLGWLGNDSVWLCPGALPHSGSWVSLLTTRTARTLAVRDTLSLQGYGRAQHSISTEKIKSKYPDYEVTWADDGY